MKWFDVVINLHYNKRKDLLFSSNCNECSSRWRKDLMNRIVSSVKMQTQVLKQWVLVAPDIQSEQQWRYRSQFDKWLWWFWYFPQTIQLFHFLVKLSQLQSCPGGLPSRSRLRSVVLLKLTFVSRKMVDMQNVEQLTPHALVILAVWEMRYEEMPCYDTTDKRHE